MTARRIWDRLHAVRRVSFSARSRSEATTGWTGTGRGVVEVEQADERTILFRERGEWAPEGGRPLGFRNTFRWTMDPGSTSIRLEHLRFGESNPVFLFDLVPAGADALESSEPHSCRLDRYRARLECEDDAIRVGWSVVGPGKDESVDYVYR